MLMGAKIRTLEHRNVALVALEHDRSAQGFCKTWTIRICKTVWPNGLQKMECQELTIQKLPCFRKTGITNVSQEIDLHKFCKIGTVKVSLESNRVKFHRKIELKYQIFNLAVALYSLIQPTQILRCITVWHKLGLSLQRKLKFRCYVRGYYLLRYRF